MIGTVFLVLLATSAASAPAASAPAPSDGAPALPEAQPVGFHARADKASVRLGEPFAYSVEVRHRPEESYALHGKPALSPFQVEGMRCRRELEKGEARTTCTMRLALFALGPVDVPDLIFDVDGPGGKARLAVPGPRITGVGVIDPRTPPGLLKLRDIAPPAPLLVPSYRLVWWALGILAAAAAAILGVGALRRARARRRTAIEPTPFERFERRIAALEAERLPQRGLGGELVARLSEAVREYLGALAGLPALDLTSAELLAALRQARASHVDLEGLELFLGEADLVKFARQPAEPEKCRAGIEYAQGLLERTRPVVTEGSAP
jgi:hypothetical protein